MAYPCWRVGHTYYLKQILFTRTYTSKLIIWLIIDLWTDAPVTNPDGITGIDLFTLVDDQIPHDTTTIANLQSNIKPMWFGTAAERANPDRVDLLAAKGQAFHYTVYAHDQPGPNVGSLGVAQRPGMDALVTLGNGWATNTEGTHSIGSADQQEGTFMHEFGHNLGLQHGGNDGINCKPNYFSVQSYLFQMSNYVSNRPLDYSCLMKSMKFVLSIMLLQ